MPEGDAKRIREYLCQLVEHARSEEEPIISMAAGEIRDALGLNHPNAIIDICQVLNTQIFHEDARVQFLCKVGPEEGASTVFLFNILKAGQVVHEKSSIARKHAEYGMYFLEQSVLSVLRDAAPDYLWPAAIGGVIHTGNVSRVKARVVVEAANQPVTPQADEVLNDRGIRVLPDLLVNAGGVIVSYFEWSQNLYQAHWDEQRVDAELTKIMTRAYNRVNDMARGQGITHREAAFLIGVGSVAHVARIRGFI